MNIELLKHGCFIMVIGMGFVYFFICIMIWAMDLVAKFIKMINKYFPEQIEEEKYQPKKKNKRQRGRNSSCYCLCLCERSKRC